MPFFTLFRQHSFSPKSAVSFHLLPPREVPFAVLLDEEEKEETKDEVPSLFNKQREVLQREILKDVNGILNMLSYTTGIL